MTRLLAVSCTLWDWDEVQFALAVENYDASDYRPHPPGFPLFIALAKLVRPFAASDFRALQAITLIAAMALFPVLFFFFRELRFRFETAFSGSLLAAFLPNVWFYGGTAFSDIPSLVLTVAGCALLLRGIRDERSALGGALVLGLAAAIRPQALLVGCAPGLTLLWKRRRHWPLLLRVLLVGAATIITAYAGAAIASASVGDYLDAGRKLREYLRHVDSFLAPSRPPLPLLFEFFFLRAIPGGAVGHVLLVAAIGGAIVSAIRREGHVWLLIATFLPFQLFAWLMLDFHSVGRYGVSFAPMYALLAASAVIGLPGLSGTTGRVAATMVVLGFAAAFARSTLPALAEVRKNASPPVVAMEWIARRMPREPLSYVHGSVIPYARYFLRSRKTAIVEVPTDMGPSPPARGTIVVTETPSPALRARRIVRGRGRLFDIVRQRYFETTIIPAESWAQFGDGWHGTEWHGATVWIWMGPRSVTHLPPLSGKAMLALSIEPVLEKGPPVVELRLNGNVIDRFAVAQRMRRSWTVNARAGAWNELVITSDRAVNPARDGLGDDPRDLSLRLLGYDWAPKDAGPQ